MTLRGRMILLLILLIIGIIFISPSIQWYFLIPEQTKNIAMGSLAQIKETAQREAEKSYLELATFTLDRKNSQESKPLSVLAQQYSAFLAKSYANLDYRVFKETIESIYRDDILNIKNLRDLTLQLGLDLQGGLYVSLSADFEAFQKRLADKLGQNTSAVEIDKNKVLQEVMERMLSRLDQFGTVEPIIRRQLGSDTIIIELPGVADEERIRKVIMGRGSLNFHLVDEETWSNFTSYLQTHPDYKPQFDANGVVIPPPDFNVPVGTLILGSYRKDKYGLDELVNYVAIREEVALSGEAIQGASTHVNEQDHSIETTFTLGSFTEKDGTIKDGAALFSDLTAKNVNKYLAVVLDNKVMQAARIRGQIPNGQVSVTGGMTYKDAEDLAKVLSTGSLPVPLTITNSSQVGASLGEDTIAKGLRGALVGALLVLGFMLVYYRGAGLIADVSMAFNVFLLLAILSATRFTLTLTSIAGIVLTIGMAVDANVIIYERIKEEYRLGKTAKAAIKAGFERAFWTILDANVTTFIAGVILAFFTKGSIQGFAFTLCAGIITSFISSLYISRILFDFRTDVLKMAKLGISWRRLQ